MDNHEAIALIQIIKGATIFRAQYLNNTGPARTYHFKDVIGLDLQVGDKAVVQTKDEYSVVEVTATRVPPHSVTCPLAALKHAIQKVDTSMLDSILESEKEAAHELAMSELHSRLAVFETQLGATGFNRVYSMLEKPIQETDEEPKK